MKFAFGLLTAAALCGVLVAIALAGFQRVASDGDPYHVSAKRLRSELAATGIEVHYVHPASERVPTVSGVARFGSGRPIGFEYQIYPSSDQATRSRLGHLHAADFGWPSKPSSPIFNYKIKGVLGNVAFAEYELIGGGDDSYTRQSSLRIQLDAQRIARALDDALFRSFPPTDPYVHAMSPTP